MGTHSDSAFARSARIRMLTMPKPSRELDPAENALRAEALDTARMAFCLALEVALEDIDPAHGHDRSPEAYARCLAGWWRHWGESPGEWTEQHMTKARAGWLRRRPDLVRHGDWPLDHDTNHTREERN